MSESYDGPAPAPHRRPGLFGGFRTSNPVIIGFFAAVVVISLVLVALILMRDQGNRAAFRADGAYADSNTGAETASAATVRAQAAASDDAFASSDADRLKAQKAEAGKR